MNHLGLKLVFVACLSVGCSTTGETNKSSREPDQNMLEAELAGRSVTFVTAGGTFKGTLVSIGRDSVVYRADRSDRLISAPTASVIRIESPPSGESYILGGLLGGTLGMLVGGAVGANSVNTETPASSVGEGCQRSQEQTASTIGGMAIGGLAGCALGAAVVAITPGDTYSLVPPEAPPDSVSRGW